MSRGSTLGRLFVLGASPGLVAIGTVATVPLMSVFRSGDYWTSFAVGQTVGELGRSVTAWGFGASISLVTRMSEAERYRHYIQSVFARLMLLAPIALIVICIVLFLPLSDHLVAVGSALAITCYGLSANWLYISEDRLNAYLWNDAFVRFLSFVLASLTVLLPQGVGADILLICILIFGHFLAIALPWLSVRRKMQVQCGVTLSQIFRILLDHSGLFLASLAMSLRMSIPSILSARMLPSRELSAFTLADKLIKWGNTATVPVSQLLQRRFGSRSKVSYVEVLLQLGVFPGLLTVISSIISYLLAPAISNGVIRLSWAQSLLLAGIIALLYMNYQLTFGYTPLLGSQKSMAVASLAVIALQFVFIVSWGGQNGAEGILFSVFGSELAYFLFQSIFILVKKRRQYNEASTAGDA